MIMTFLLNISSNVGLQNLPEYDHENWQTHGWEKSLTPKTSLPQYILFATSTKLPTDCEQDPSKVIVSPTVILGSSRFFADGRLIFSAGDNNYAKAGPLYTQPSFPCTYVPKGTQTIAWEMTTSAKNFARIATWPEVQNKPPWQPFFSETLQSANALTLLFLSAFVAIVYSNHERRAMIFTFVFSSFSAALFFGFYAGTFSFLSFSYLEAQRYASAGIWIGLFGALNILRLRQLLAGWILATFGAITTLSLVLILSGKNADQIRVAAMLPHFPGYAIILIVLVTATRHCLHTHSIRNLVEALAALGFVLAGGSDMTTALGVIHNGPMILHVGVSLMFVFLAVAIHYDQIETVQTQERALMQARHEATAQRLRSAERERQISVEVAVAKATRFLAHDVRKPLASCIMILDAILDKTDPIEAKKSIEASLPKLTKALGWVDVLVEDVLIIGRNANGAPNQQELLVISEVVSLAIQHVTDYNELSHLKISFNNETDSSSVTFANHNRLGRSIENILNNAVRAVDKKHLPANRAAPEVWVNLKTEATGETKLVIGNNGEEIPEAILSQLFKAYNTSEIGGTGLGLVLVWETMEELGGSVSCSTSPSKTSFILTFPAAKKESA